MRALELSKGLKKDLISLKKDINKAIAKLQSIITKNDLETITKYINGIIKTLNTAFPLFDKIIWEFEESAVSVRDTHHLSKEFGELAMRLRDLKKELEGLIHRLNYLKNPDCSLEEAKNFISKDINFLENIILSFNDIIRKFRIIIIEIRSIGRIKKAA